MSIARRLRGVDWVTLFAELILIFVGISAALWFDNMNEQRRDRVRETSILADIAQSLVLDTADLNLNVQTNRGTASSIDSVLAWLADDRTLDSTIASHFGSATGISIFIPNVAAFENLKSVGVGVISDDDLRLAITQYYENAAGLVMTFEEVIISRHWNDEIKPRMMDHFEYELWSNPIYPRDVEALRQDHRFRAAFTTYRAMLPYSNSYNLDARNGAELLLQSIEQRVEP